MKRCIHFADTIVLLLLAACNNNANLLTNEGGENGVTSESLKQYRRDDMFYWDIISYGRGADYWQCKTLVEYFKHDKLPPGYARIFLHYSRYAGYEDVPVKEIIRKLDPKCDLAIDQVMDTMKKNWWQYNTRYADHFVFGILINENGHCTLLVLWDDDYVPERYRDNKAPYEYIIIQKILDYMDTDEFERNKKPFVNKKPSASLMKELRNRVLKASGGGG